MGFKHRHKPPPQTTRDAGAHLRLIKSESLGWGLWYEDFLQVPQMMLMCSHCGGASAFWLDHSLVHGWWYRKLVVRLPGSWNSATREYLHHGNWQTLQPAVLVFESQLSGLRTTGSKERGFMFAIPWDAFQSRVCDLLSTGVETLTGIQVGGDPKPGPEVISWRWFYPSGNGGNFWRHLWLSQPGSPS